MLFMGHVSTWALLFLVSALVNALRSTGKTTVNVFSLIIASLLFGSFSYMAHVGLWAKLIP